MTGPARRWTEYMPLDDLPPASRNPKEHDLDELRDGIERFGLGSLPMLDERTGRLVAGAGRRLVLRELREEGKNPPIGVELHADGTWLVPVERGWTSRSDADAEGYGIADNGVTRQGGWDLHLLHDVLRDQPELRGLGVGDIDLSEFTNQIGDALAAVPSSLDRDPDRQDSEDEDGEEPEAPQDTVSGTLLPLAGLTVGEPDHQVTTGQVWQLGGHLLAVADLLTGWPTWRDLLTGDVLFAPYPNVMAPFSARAQSRPLLMVQPNHYLAGWIITKWSRISGLEPRLIGGPA